MLKAKSSENFQVPTKMGQIFAVLGFWGQGFTKGLIFTPKGTSLRGFTLFKPFCVKIGWGVWPPGLLGKNKEVLDWPQVYQFVFSSSMSRDMTEVPDRLPRPSLTWLTGPTEGNEKSPLIQCYATACTVIYFFLQSGVPVNVRMYYGSGTVQHTKLLQY